MSLLFPGTVLGPTLWQSFAHRIILGTFPPNPQDLEREASFYPVLSCYVSAFGEMCPSLFLTLTVFRSESISELKAPL